jgi:F-type H+-transporting ATPase subunit epsilon
MSGVFALNIVSVEGLLFAGSVTFVKFPGLMGEIGVFANHAALLTVLKPGLITYYGLTANGVLCSSGGIVEVKNNIVNILPDSCYRAEDLDEVAILEAKKRAEQLMKEKKDPQSFEQAYTELTRSMMLLRSIHELHKIRGKY